MRIAELNDGVTTRSPIFGAGIEIAAAPAPLVVANLVLPSLSVIRTEDFAGALPIAIVSGRDIYRFVFHL